MQLSKNIPWFCTRAWEVFDSIIGGPVVVNRNWVLGIKSTAVASSVWLTEFLSTVSYSITSATVSLVSSKTSISLSVDGLRDPIVDIVVGRRSLCQLSTLLYHQGLHLIIYHTLSQLLRYLYLYKVSFFVSSHAWLAVFCPNSASIVHHPMAKVFIFLYRLIKFHFLFHCMLAWLYCVQIPDLCPNSASIVHRPMAKVFIFLYRLIKFHFFVSSHACLAVFCPNSGSLSKFCTYCS